MATSIERGFTMSFAEALWRSLKVPRKLPIGPVSLVFRFTRHVRVSSNLQRRFVQWVGRTGAPAVAMPAKARPAPEPLPGSVAPQPPMRPETALVVGVGPGLGHALARALADAGMQVALASRNAERLDALVADISRTAHGPIAAYGCDATDVLSVRRLMERVTLDMGAPDLVVFSVQSFGPGRAIDVEVPAFEDNWRQNCLGGFIVAQAAARAMLPRGSGTIVLVGSTSGMHARADHLNLAVGKFGLRAIAQVMSRELWPEGIHVVHCVIDADIQEDGPDPSGAPQSRPEDIAAVICGLHGQPRSCWTSELDMRPWNERFWEHC